ncbi:MAG: GNAT family N-acetyltransferase, partial [Verrucomicrobiota bacterium]
RVARLVEIAHPDHREALLAGALARGWLPRFFTMPTNLAVVSDGGIESAWVEFQLGRFLFRPLHPSDMRTLQEFFYSHDEETIRLRYGYQRERMSGESAYKLAAVDQTRDVALGIFTERHGRQQLRAIGRYYLDDDGKRAEVAFVVHEAARQAGMAGFLLGELAVVAARRGIDEFWASVLPNNRAMGLVFTAAGGTEEAVAMGEERSFRMSVGHIVEDRKRFLQRKHIRKFES